MTRGPHFLRDPPGLRRNSRNSRNSNVSHNFSVNSDKIQLHNLIDCLLVRQVVINF